MHKQADRPHLTVFRSYPYRVGIQSKKITIKMFDDRLDAAERTFSECLTKLFHEVV